MKSIRFLFFLSTKFFGILFGFLVLAFCYGCQKDSFESGNPFVPKSGSTALAIANFNNYMVITKSETLPVGFETLFSAYGKIVRSIPEIGVVVIKPTISDFETRVAKLTAVKAVVPDLMAKMIEPIKFIEESNPPSIGTDETYFYREWGMDAIDAPEAWNAGYRGQGAKVFILDSGIDADNPDLAPNLNTALSTSFVPGENYYVGSGSFFNHGTHVAGIIAAADNHWGVIGVAPYAEIVAVKVLSETTGSGAFSWVNAGIVYAANNGADVINMSLGATLDRNGFYLDDNNVLQKVPAVYIQSYILAQQRAVNYAFQKGAVIVTSAGNDGINADGNASLFILPADLQNVIAVSAIAPYHWYNDWLNRTLDPDFDIPASYTNYGKSLVGVAAPGGDFDAYPLINYSWDYVLSDGAGGPTTYPFYYACGTSMAAPHVSGVAALIIAKNGGEMNPVAVTRQLFKTADKIDGNGISAWYGNGRVNAFRAVTE
jgi:subtilisin family serine protease